MAINWTAKDPDEVLDYTWKPALDDGDTISTHTIGIESGNAVIDSDSKTDTSVTAFISGGTEGETNSFLARVVTNGGRTFEDTIYLPIKSSNDALISTLKLRYPAFSNVSDNILDYWLTDAQRYVDDSWLTEDQDPALMAMAAHNLASQGVGEGAIPIAGVTKFKSASFEATISDSVAGTTGLRSTKYGREYAQFLARNKAGPRLAVSS